jgi:hypothetical protein
MFTRFDIARKVYHIFISTRKTFEGFAQLGFIPDCNCAFDAVQDEAMAMLELMFPEIDDGYFESFFYEVGEIGSEADFIAMLEELSEQKDNADNEKMKEPKETKAVNCDGACNCHNKEKSSTNTNKGYSRTYAVVNVPTQEEIERAIRALFGSDFI